MVTPVTWGVEKPQQKGLNHNRIADKDMLQMTVQ